MLKDKLLQLDFTPNQVKTYLALLELGQTKVGPILWKTGFHRNIVYRALEDLMARKLVNKISKRGVAYFSAIDPEPLLLEQEKKKDLAKDIVKEIKSIKKQTYSEAIILTGEQGIMDLAEMIIKEGDDVCIIGAVYNFGKKLGKRFEYMLNRGKKKKIKQYALVQPHVTKQENDYFKIVEDYRYLPKGYESSPHAITIFGNVVAHILWEEPETIFVVKNKIIADSYRKYFEILWDQAKPMIKKKT